MTLKGGPGSRCEARGGVYSVGRPPLVPGDSPGGNPGWHCEARGRQASLRARGRAALGPVVRPERVLLALTAVCSQLLSEKMLLEKEF